MNFWIGFSISAISRNAIEILIGITLSSEISLGSNAILLIFNFMVHERMDHLEIYVGLLYFQTMRYGFQMVNFAFLLLNLSLSSLFF